MFPTFLAAEHFYFSDIVYCVMRGTCSTTPFNLTYLTSHITHYNMGVLHYKETKCKTLYISHESHYTAGAS